MPLRKVLVCCNAEHVHRNQVSDVDKVGLNRANDAPGEAGVAPKGDDLVVGGEIVVPGEGD